MNIYRLSDDLSNYLYKKLAYSLAIFNLDIDVLAWQAWILYPIVVSVVYVLFFFSINFNY